MNRTCPAGCGHRLQRADILCPDCVRKLPNQTRLDLGRTWRAWIASFSPDDLAAYQRCADYAVKLARQRIGQDRLPA